MLNQPHHLKVSVIIAFHKNFYNESKATTAQYVRSNISLLQRIWRHLKPRLNANTSTVIYVLVQERRRLPMDFLHVPSATALLRT